MGTTNYHNYLVLQSEIRRTFLSFFQCFSFSQWRSRRAAFHLFYRLYSRSFDEVNVPVDQSKASSIAYVLKLMTSRLVGRI